MVESVQFLKSAFFKNVSNQGGAQAHAIKTCPQGNIVLSRCKDKSLRLWGSMTQNHYLNTVAKDHNLFEIITKYPHKVYFDIDGPHAEDFPTYIEQVKQKILEYFPNAEMALSGSNTEKKASIHVVLQNYMIFTEFQRDQVKEIAMLAGMGFDTAVYTKNRLMKCVNQSKTDGRVQAIIENADLKAHTITSFFTEPLPFPTLEHVVEKVNIRTADHFDFGSLPKISYKTDIVLQDLTPIDVLALLPCSPAYKHNYTHLVARFCFSNGISYGQFMQWRSQKGERDWSYNWSRLHLFPPVSFERIKSVCCASCTPSSRKTSTTQPSCHRSIYHRPKSRPSTRRISANGPQFSIPGWVRAKLRKPSTTFTTRSSS